MQSRFKTYLIDFENLSLEAKGFQVWWNFYFSKHQSQLISDAEWVFCVLSEILETRAPGQWWKKGAAPSVFCESPESSHLFSERPHFQKMGVSSPADFFKKYSLKKIPGGITEILCRWSQGSVGLQLETSPITPLQMLERQAQKKRVVTLACTKILKGEWVDGKRDGFEFLLHDLMHAFHFFSETHEEQVEFFSQLLACYPLYLKSSMTDSVFAKELEYIMSDMNTNIHHLRLSLRAALIDRERRKESLLPHERLSEMGEIRWNQQFLSFC